MNKFIVFTNGDSNKLSTWSNVPYFFTEELIRQGNTIYRVDIGYENFSCLEKLIVRFEEKFLTARKLLTHKDMAMNYMRTVSFEIIQNRKINAAWKAYPDAEAQIVLSYSCMGSKRLKDKTILVCDWTFQYYIEEQLKRLPDMLEKKYIARENDNIHNAKYVVSIFPDAARCLSRYFDKKIDYYGYINTDIDSATKFLVLGTEKFASKHYLFIGNKQYYESARKLIDAVESINRTRTDNYLYVDIIGLDGTQYPELETDYSKCYGYLNKNNDEQNELFYSLLCNAKALVNITENWNGMSSLVEAMYYYTPIIASKNENILYVMQDENVNVKGGILCQPPISTDGLIDKINAIEKMSIEEYNGLINDAHENVKEYTWHNFVSKLMKYVNEDLGNYYE